MYIRSKFARKAHIGLFVTLVAAAIGCYEGFGQQLPTEISPAVNPPANVILPPGTNQPPNPPAAADARPRPTDRQTIYTTTKTPFEFYLAVLTILLGISALTLVSVLFWRHIQEKTDEFGKLFASTLVIFAAIFLVVVGYADSQVAPLYSLLGTILGYVFGRGAPARQEITPPVGPAPTTSAPPPSAPIPPAPVGPAAPPATSAQAAGQAASPP
jgi:hypothetical protein